MGTLFVKILLILIFLYICYDYIKHIEMRNEILQMHCRYKKKGKEKYCYKNLTDCCSHEICMSILKWDKEYEKQYKN